MRDDPRNGDEYWRGYEAAKLQCAKAENELRAEEREAIAAFLDAEATSYADEQWALLQRGGAMSFNPAVILRVRAQMIREGAALRPRREEHQP